MNLLIQFIKWLWKYLSLLFNWIRYHIVKPLSSWHQENLLKSKLLIVAAFLFVMTFIFVDARISAPMHSKFESTRLNEPQTLGQNSQAAMAITSREYNSKKDFMVVKMHASSTDSKPLDPDNVKFKAQAYGKKKIPVQKIALTNNDYVLLLNDLKPGYRAIQLRVINTQASTKASSIDTGDDTDDEDSMSTASSKSSSVKANGAGPNYFNFIINEDEKFVNNKLAKRSQADYMIEDIETQIARLKKKIKQNNSSIDSGIKQAKADQVAIDQINKQSQYSTNKETDSSKIQDYQSDFQEQENTITQLNKDNEKKQDQIKLYQKQIRDIRSGHYQFDND